MKIVRVTYTTKPEYSATNQANIKKVMDDLMQAAVNGINYTACMDADGKTFTHLAFFDSEEDRRTLNELASFKKFQEELRASQPEIAPRQDFPTLIGSSKKMFAP